VILDPVKTMCIPEHCVVGADDVYEPKIDSDAMMAALGGLMELKL